MADIFISYSSRDQSNAELLAEQLASTGLSVWIDRSGIGVATNWSKEIVQAIDGCTAFVVLLSSFSVESKNVVREVALAFEKNKKILPLDLEPISLSDDLQYLLAGIQRAPVTNIDAVILALEKLGLKPNKPAKAADMPTITGTVDPRKSLIILPFEDLSPTQDNLWFADGLAGELIDALGHIKSLRILDRKTSLELRGVRQSIVEIGKLFTTRYFIEGSVRKFGDEIKISCSLLDIETGDHLWQQSHRGEFKDIFDIQETVAQKVVEGLKLHLTKEEKSLLEERGTENAEAYELGIKANEYYNLQTKQGYELCSQLSSEAILLDPNYVDAYASKANALVSLYRDYNHASELLDEAERLCTEAMSIRNDFSNTYRVLSKVRVFRGDLAGAEALLIEAIRRDPQNFMTHFGLAYFYFHSNQLSKAIASYKDALTLNPDNLQTLTNVALAYYQAGDKENCKAWATRALGHSTKYLKLHPDDEDKQVRRAVLLFYSGREEEALAAAEKFERIRDGNTLYNVACLWSMLGRNDDALRIYRKAIEAGYKNIQLLKQAFSDEENDNPSFTGNPEYQKLKEIVGAMEREAQ